MTFNSLNLKCLTKPIWVALLWIVAAGVGCGGNETVVSRSGSSVSTVTTPRSETGSVLQEAEETPKTTEAPWALRWKNRHGPVPADLFYSTLGRALSTSPVFKAIQASHICGFAEMGIEVVAEGKQLDTMNISFDELARAAKQAVPSKIAARAEVNNENRTVTFASLEYHWDDEERLEMDNIKALMQAPVGVLNIELRNLAQILERPLSQPQRCEDEEPCIYMQFFDGTRRESVAQGAAAISEKNPHLIWEILPRADVPCF